MVSPPGVDDNCTKPQQQRTGMQGFGFVQAKMWANYLRCREKDFHFIVAWLVVGAVQEH